LKKTFSKLSRSECKKFPGTGTTAKKKKNPRMRHRGHAWEKKEDPKLRTNGNFPDFTGKRQKLQEEGKSKGLSFMEDGFSKTHHQRVKCHWSCGPELCTRGKSWTLQMQSKHAELSFPKSVVQSEEATGLFHAGDTDNRNSHARPRTFDKGFGFFWGGTYRWWCSTRGGDS